MAQMSNQIVHEFGQNQLNWNQQNQPKTQMYVFRIAGK